MDEITSVPPRGEFDNVLWPPVPGAIVARLVDDHLDLDTEPLQISETRFFQTSCHFHDGSKKVFGKDVSLPFNSSFPVGFKKLVKAVRFESVDFEFEPSDVFVAEVFLGVSDVPTARVMCVAGEPSKIEMLPVTMQCPGATGIKIALPELIFEPLEYFRFIVKSPARLRGKFVRCFLLGPCFVPWI